MKSLISICANFLTTKDPHIADRFCVDFDAYLIILFKSICEKILGVFICCFWIDILYSVLPSGINLKYSPANIILPFLFNIKV